MRSRDLPPRDHLPPLWCPPGRGPIERPASEPRAVSHYQEEFRKIHRSGETYKGKWNWAAFFGGAFWAFAKGLWVPLAICILAGLVSFGILGVVYWIILGARGNFLYYNLYVKNRALVI